MKKIKMIKIKALNEVTNIENNEEYHNSLTKEAQEQIALNEYNRALQLLLQNNKEEALIVLKELVNTELLSTVRKHQFQDGNSRPMLALKYSCYKNIAGIEAEFKDYHAAICNYWEAANLDDSDVMLWYKIGLTAIEIANLDVASLAFTEGLKRNKYHWPCLDHVITVLYAIPDHVNCLYYISMALGQDPTYIKGLAFCKDILKSIPELKNFIVSSKNEWIIDLLNFEYDTACADLLIKEAVGLQEKWIKMSQDETLSNSLNNIKLRRMLEQHSWLELGKSLVDMYNYISDNNFNFMSCILFEGFDQFNQKCSSVLDADIKLNIDISKTSMKTVSLSNILKKTNDHSFSDSSHHLKESVKLGKEEKSNSYEVQNVDENLYLNDLDLNYSNSHNFEENINMNENCKTSDIDHDKVESSVIELEKSNSELVSQSFEDNEIRINLDIKDKVQKVKKRRRSSLCFLTQWAWSASCTKRSSRARNIGRKEYEKDGLLEETLRRIFPPSFKLMTLNALKGRS